MEFGLFTEFASPPGVSDAAAFDESLGQMKAAEAMGFDAVWLAEIHFQKDRSVLASPLVIASALAACTRRVKIGIAVQVLPLSHPLRLAEDMGFSTLSRWMNPGGRIPNERVLKSMRLFAERVAPRLA